MSEIVQNKHFEELNDKKEEEESQSIKPNNQNKELFQELKNDDEEEINFILKVEEVVKDENNKSK